MSSTSKLPDMDMSYNGGNGYNSLSELMRAMILRTVEDFNGEGELKEAAVEYMEDAEEEYIFSFRHICQHFGMDPDKTRDAIMNATKRISTRRRAA
jgi:hypothetical protein